MRKLYPAFLLLLFLTGCGEYSPSKHDVVNVHGNLENLNLLENFIEDVSLDRDSEVRVVNYTNEGDPIIQDLKYSNDKITSILDTREDEYGDQLVKEDVCESIKKVDKNNLTIYQLDGCRGKEKIIHVTVIATE